MTSTGSAQEVLPRGVKLISVWFIIFGALSWFLGARAILLLAFPAAVPEILGSDPYIANFGLSFGSSVGVDLSGDALIFCGLGVLNTAAMVGMLRLRGWARWLAIGLVAPGVILFPLGLSPSPVLFMAGGLMIWYLLFSDKGKRAFGALLPEPTLKESI